MKKKIIAAATVCAMILCAAGCGAAQAQSASSAAQSDSSAAQSATSTVQSVSAAAPAVSLAGTAEKVTVSASGSVSLVPDKATVTFGVTTKEETAEEAQRKNNESVQNVLDVLTARGIEEKSIKTTYYSMYPQYYYSDDGNQTIVGYYVTTNMSVQDQNVEDVGELISACVDAGANNVDNVSFLCSGYDEAYKEALANAVAESRVKAEALAAAAGKKLGDVIAITEGWQDTSARYGNSLGTYVEEAAMDSSAPVLQPGETNVTANVTVEYQMQ